jgi:hypothetical protein
MTDTPDACVSCMLLQTDSTAAADSEHVLVYYCLVSSAVYLVQSHMSSQCKWTLEMQKICCNTAVVLAVCSVFLQVCSRLHFVLYIDAKPQGHSTYGS